MVYVYLAIVTVFTRHCNIYFVELNSAMIQEKCNLPGCGNLVKNWRRRFCCMSHGGKFSAMVKNGLAQPLEDRKYQGVRDSFVGPKLPKLNKGGVEYKNRTPQQKAKWIEYVVARQKRIKTATPKWANRDDIKEVYIKAQILTKETGIKHEVDHIVPLTNKLVCGLHVEHNLRVVTFSENRSKSNKFIVG